MTTLEHAPNCRRLDRVVLLETCDNCGAMRDVTDLYELKTEGDLCSICRRFHGMEIIHECE